MFTALILLPACAAFAQTQPFCNLYWEANDGSVWARGSVATTNQTVQVRLSAEWAAPGSLGFGATRFDALIQNADVSDAIADITRLAPFDHIGQTIGWTFTSEGIKLDDVRDSSAAGQGPYWIDCGQNSDAFGGAVDGSNPARLMAFILQLANQPGTRHIGSIHQAIVAGSPENVLLWTPGGGSVHVVATIHPLDVTFVPMASAWSTSGLLVLLTAARRPRRTRVP